MQLIDTIAEIEGSRQPRFTTVDIPIPRDERSNRGVRPALAEESFRHDKLSLTPVKVPHRHAQGDMAFSQWHHSEADQIAT